MLQPSKTVFISYRRTNVPWALNIFQYLTQHGFDVFFDYETIGSGDFESIILGNVLSRAHFLIVLTPSSLERCSEPGDWFRREIETAIDSNRNIVPLMLDSFDFYNPKIAGQLTGKLASLKAYNGIGMNAEYFFAAMDKLRTKYLHVHLDAVPHPAHKAAQTAAVEQMAAAQAAPPVQEKELTAQEYFERAYVLTDPTEEIRLNTEAIRLKPDFSQAFNNRGTAQQTLGNLDAAIADYSKAIQIKPDFHEAFNNRGLAHQGLGNLDAAIADYSKAIQIKPDFHEAFNSRGTVHKSLGNLDAAIADYSQAIQIKPDKHEALFNRGILYRHIDRPDLAIADFQKYLEVGGGEKDGDTDEVRQMIQQLKESEGPPPAKS